MRHKDATGRLLGVNESVTVDKVGTFPADRKVGFRFLELDRLRIPVAGELAGEPISWIQHPGVPRFAGKERQLAGGNKAFFAFGGPAPNVLNLPGGNIREIAKAE
jgi:hypothetical protein